MELIQRIIANVVGQEITVAEQQEVAGGMIDVCKATGGYYTAIRDIDGTGLECDYN